MSSVGESRKYSVQQILEHLLMKRWWVPDFQREFVWNPTQVSELCVSVLANRPCGMFTLWSAQPDDEVTASWIGLDDSDGPVHFHALGEIPKGPNPNLAIIDGKQRCTALAIAFGGMQTKGSAKGGRRPPFTGRFFLDIKDPDVESAIKFKKSSEIRKLDLTSTEQFLEHGLLPLAPIEMPQVTESKNFVELHWERMNQWLSNPQKFTKKVPSWLVNCNGDELIERFWGYKKGVLEAKFASFELGEGYDLSVICDVFQILNKSGTPVSTTDIIHTYLFQQYRKLNQDFSLREWIEKLDDDPGMRSWKPSQKPETVAQFVGATYLAHPSPSPARKLQGRSKPLETAKNSDLVRLPFDHWKHVIERQDNDQSLSKALNAFQECVTDGGRFNINECPYQILAPLYVGLIWRTWLELPEDQWNVADLDALFRPFFWRACLTSKYNLAALPQMSSDMKSILAALAQRGKYQSMGAWKKKVVMKLFDDTFAASDYAPEADLVELAIRKPEVGSALWQSVALAAHASARRDLLEPSTDYVDSREPTQAHHIFPIAWFRRTAPSHPPTAGLTEKERDTLRECIANKTPLSETSNGQWEALSPATALKRFAKAHYSSNQIIWSQRSISKLAYKQLELDNPVEFARIRATDIAKRIYSLAEL